VSSPIERVKLDGSGRTRGARPTPRRDLSQFLVWFDAEFSTLELEKAWLLQVAMGVTDSDLRWCGPDGPQVWVVRLPPRATVSPWVRTHLADLVHQSRGAEARGVEEVDQDLTEYLVAALGPIPLAIERRPVLAGNSIHTDWWLIRRFLPRFAACLHYRHLDVTAFKLEWRRLCPEFDFDKARRSWVQRFLPAVWRGRRRRHDALYDLQASVAELAFYRQHLLRRRPKVPVGE